MLSQNVLKDVSFVIPAYNEENSLPHVVQTLRKLSPGEIIVVDDGSSDKTFAAAKSLGCRTFRFKRNRGKAAACLFGAGKAKHEYLIFIDADAQFKPEDAIPLRRKLDNHDMVLGSRNFSLVPFQRRLSNAVARRIINSLTGLSLNDALCGFRAVRRDVILSLGLEKNGYEFESETLIKARKRGMSVCEVPVSVDYSGYRGMPLMQSIRLLCYLAKEWLKSRLRL